MKLHFGKLLILGAIAMGLMVSMNSCSDSDKESGNTGGNTPTPTPTPTPETKMTIPSLNVTSAKGLAVANKDGSTYPTENNLFQVANDGKLKVPEYTSTAPAKTKGGSSVASCDARVTSMIDLNDDYLYLGGSFTFTEKDTDTSTTSKTLNVQNLLLNKKTGAMYEWGNENSIDANNPIYEYSGIQKDGKGNIYYGAYCSGGSGVKKVNLSNPLSISIEDYMLEGQHSIYFCTDSKGNCLYLDGGDQETYKVRKAQGGLQAMGKLGFSWYGHSGNFYCINNANGASSLTAKISKLENNNDNFSVVTEWSSDNYDTVNYLCCTSYSSTKVLKGSNSELVFIRKGTISNCAVFVYSETSKKITLVPSIGDLGYNTTLIVNSQNYYYIATGTHLYKVPFATHTPVDLLQTIGSYEIYTMEVDSNDNLSISALRYSDGKKIIGYIDNTGTLTVTDESSDRKVTVLKKLN